MTQFNDVTEHLWNQIRIILNRVDKKERRSSKHLVELTNQDIALALAAYKLPAQDNPKLQERVDKCLSVLTKDQLRIVKTKYFTTGYILDNIETARILRLKPQSVRRMLHRAMVRMRRVNIF